MNRKIQLYLRRVSILIIVASISVIFGILFASKMNWTEVSVAESDFQTASNQSYYPLNEDGESPFIAVAERVKPAVVSISAERKANTYNPHDSFDFGPFKDFFDQRENTPRRSPTVQAGGTGIIISKDGLVLTNNHIVAEADKVTIRLSDDSEFDAEIVGTDPQTDIALLKVDAKFSEERVAHLGDSEKIKIGGWAIAIGNPFGLDWTVTVGVISAIGRGGLNFGGQDGPIVQDFIQTDASINYGNSGGPLMNIRGEVIGINSAINSRGQGIGFAIPINMAKEVAEQLLDHGRVSHGYLGMVPAELTPLKKEALGLEKKVRGVFVDRVEDNTPAHEGGLKPGDVIIKFDGNKITSVTQFRNLVARKRSGEKVSATIVRDGRESKLSFNLGERPDFSQARSENKIERDVWMGIYVEDFRSNSGDNGVIIRRIESDSPAVESLRERDIIIEIDKRPVQSIEDFKEISEDMKDRRKSILFRISRDGRKTFEVVKPK